MMALFAYLLSTSQLSSMVPSHLARMPDHKPPHTYPRAPELEEYSPDRLGAAYIERKGKLELKIKPSMACPATP